nr:(2Fe-2S)-binding protein [Sedimentibacter sp.]
MPTREVENDNICPICKCKGIEVKNKTIKHLIISELIDQVKDYNYFVCMSEECNVVYFSPSIGTSYSKEQIKVPIWFKKDANPKFICYCNQVTEQQIINAVLHDGAKNMKDIIRLTGAMKNGKCEINNPLGKCCSPVIQETINKTLNIIK